MIEITLTEINGYTRKAFFEALIYNHRSKAVTTQWKVQMFDEEGNELNSTNAPWYKSYSKEFIADESVYVDPQTGAVLDPEVDDMEGAVTEWYYFSEIVANNSVVVNDMILAVGTARAAQGKFEYQ